MEDSVLKKMTWWYWLWVQFTRSGRDFDLSHNITYEERKKISKKLRKRINEYGYIISFWIIILLLLVLYIKFR